MFLKRYLPRLILVLLSATLASAQTTSVTATVTYPDAQPLANASITVSFVPNPQFPTANYVINGSAFPHLVTATSDGTGTFNLTLTDSALISPRGSQWSFSVCPPTTSPCVTLTTPVSGASANLSTSLSNAAVQPTNKPLFVPIFYSDMEANPTANYAAMYFNVISGLFRCYTGTGWINCGSGGGGGVSSVGLALPASLFTVSGSPVTATGTLTGSFVTNFAANSVFGNCTGAPATPGACSLTLAMLPAGVGLTANPLSQFASTTSAQLAGVISDETGAGALVFGTAPTISAPVFATSTTFNFITGVAAQCLHVNTSGVVSGTGSDCGSSGGSGTVTSIGITQTGSVFTITGSPVTTSGNINLAFASETANTVFAAPNGASGAPTFRALVTADLPTGIPIGNVGSVGLSGTSPIAIASSGAISCTTCGVTTSGLNQFASTTSAQLAGVISDETGSGKLMFATNPVMASFFDVTEIAAPANPSAGNERWYANSTTHQLSCLTSAGGNCAPSGGGSGTINAAAQFDSVYYSGAGSSSTVSGLDWLTGYDGVPQTQVETTSGAAQTTPTPSVAGVVPNAQTGTTYTVVLSDRAKYVSFSNAASIAVTLPQAGSTGFDKNFVFVTCDIGAGTATITPTTSTISFSTGSGYSAAQTSMALAQGTCAWIYSDNTNYFAIKFVDTSTSGLSGMTTGQVAIAGSATTITSSKALAGAGAGVTTGPTSSTSTDLASFSGTAGQLQDSGILSTNVATATSAAGAANQVVLSNAADKTLKYATADSTTTHAFFATASAPAFRAIATGDLPAALSSQTSVNGTSIPASATLAQVICSGTIALGTTAIASGNKSTVSTTTCTGLATTDNIMLDFNADPSAVTGYAPSANGTLTIIKFPTANTINIYQYNDTASSITPGAMTVNYRVLR